MLYSEHFELKKEESSEEVKAVRLLMQSSFRFNFVCGVKGQCGLFRVMVSVDAYDKITQVFNAFESHCSTTGKKNSINYCPNKSLQISNRPTVVNRIDSNVVELLFQRKMYKYGGGGCSHGEHRQNSAVVDNRLDKFMMA